MKIIKIILYVFLGAAALALMVLFHGLMNEQQIKAQKQIENKIEQLEKRLEK